MQVKYVGPFDAIELDGVGIVKQGETVDVPADVAGRPPVARVEAAHAELGAAVGALDHERAKALREEIVDLDHGAGLLAQTSNWQAVTSKSSKSVASGEEAQP
jgi:hypothetical protein